MSGAAEIENPHEGAHLVRGPAYGRRRQAHQQEKEETSGADVQPLKKSGWGEQEGEFAKQLDAQRIEEMRAKFMGEEAIPEIQTNSSAPRNNDERPVDLDAMATMVTEKPADYLAQKLPALPELDAEREFGLPTAEGDLDIDITPLLVALTPGKINEPDEVWDADLLFTELSSTLQEEHEKLLVRCCAVMVACAGCVGHCLSFVASLQFRCVLIVEVIDRLSVSSSRQAAQAAAAAYAQQAQ